MADVIFIVVSLGFFAVGWLYLRGCDRIVASGEEPGPAEVSR